MKRLLPIALLFVAAAGLAVAQTATPTGGDVLGAHLMYGRGCVGCHAPHNGPAENNLTTPSPTGAASYILWGEDTSFLAGKTLTFGDPDSGYTYAVGSLTDGTDETKGILLCLSCHDGSIAQSAMMKGTTYEAVNVTNGSTTTPINPPTWLGKDGGYQNDHPVGPNAKWSVNGYSWTDATLTNGKIVPGPAGGPSALFNADYGFFVSFGTTIPGEVLCTSCHNQHNMNAVKVSSRNSAMTPGIYTTMFFLVGPYNPNSTTAKANSTAQFCRQCHAYGANETMGGSNPTIM